MGMHFKVEITLIAYIRAFLSHLIKAIFFLLGVS